MLCEVSKTSPRANRHITGPMEDLHICHGCLEAKWDDPFQVSVCMQIKQVLGLQKHWCLVRYSASQPAHTYCSRNQTVALHPPTSIPKACFRCTYKDIRYYSRRLQASPGLQLQFQKGRFLPCVLCHISPVWMVWICGPWCCHVAGCILLQHSTYTA